jgi:hypothetical protein
MSDPTTPTDSPSGPVEADDPGTTAETYEGPSQADLALAARARNRRPSRLGDVPRRVLIALLLVGVVVGIAITGRMAVTGTGSTSDALPDSVERLIPASGAQALRQAQVGIDVADGYDAYLQINGVTIKTAEDGLIKDGTGLVQFQPGPDRPIESLNQGQNCVTAFVWKQRDGEATAEPVAWCFNAT